MYFSFFFFQAEDGIRDLTVTGVQTCALPISSRISGHPRSCVPTEPQLRGWPEIREGRDVLISAPTGSGKTLAAFLICIDSLVRRARLGPLPDQTEVVYVSPLKALSNDIHKNLEIPLAEIRALAEARGV